MRVLVTGATGFAGRWLMRELTAAGHEAIGTRGRADPDITDPDAVAALVRTTGPDAIAHLAGIAFGPDARNDPATAIAVNAGGTRCVLEAASRSSRPIRVLVVSSSEVYGHPRAADLPITEGAPLRADQPYGRSKIAEEGVAAEYAGHAGLSIVTARPFNHTGPGQRLEFVVPALATRILAAAEGGGRSIVAGNVDVRRDFSDVRDVVRAYRMLLEVAERRQPDRHPRVYNIASGRSIAIREIVERLARIVGIEIRVEVDPALVRADDPAEITGDATRIAEETGWQPVVPLDRTLSDVLGDVEARVHADRLRPAKERP